MLPFVPLLALMNLPLPASLEGVQRIVMLGDSITQVGDGPDGYVGIVRNTLKGDYPDHPIEVINAGISGQKAPDMHARFQRDVLDKHPQIVMISVGVNDVWHDFRTPQWTARVPTGDSGRGVKLPIYNKEVEAMVAEAQAAGTRVIILSPTLVYEDLNCAENKRLMEYARAERQIADTHHATFVDLNRTFRDVVAKYQQAAGKRSLLLTVDGVHMNKAGNALMADCVLKALEVPVPDDVAPK